MISDALQKWTIVTIVCLSAVHPQMMPMGYGYGGPMMMPAPMPMAMPMPMPVPVPIPIPYTESTSTTTTTTTEANHGGNDNGMAIGIPIPVPHFVQIAIPGVMPPNCTPKTKNNGKNKNCPPCPPCSCNPCTPSFFSYCSPCHQECRCKNGQKNPIPKDPTPPHPMPGPAFPMPIPIPGPPPVVIVPFPPQFAHPPKKPRPHNSDCDSRSVSKSSSCSKESTDSSESDHSWRKKKRKRKKKKSKYDINRRNFNLMKRNRGDSELVKPVLTYRSRNGDIKMRRRLSNDEADILLGERNPYKMERDRDGETYNNVRLMAEEDENKRPRIVVRSNPGMRLAGKHRRKQLVLNGDSQQMLEDGKKELVFRTLDNQKISNLSVSFNIGS